MNHAADDRMKVQGLARGFRAMAHDIDKLGAVGNTAENPEVADLAKRLHYILSAVQVYLESPDLIRKDGTGNEWPQERQ